MKLKNVIALTTLTLITSVSTYAKPSTCALGETCVLGKGMTKVAVIPEEGTAFSCDITADNDSTLSFNVRGGGDYRLTEGAGSYQAAPAITVSVVGEFKTKTAPKSGGSITFGKTKGGTGTVVCMANVLKKK